MLNNIVSSTLKYIRQFCRPSSLKWRMRKFLHQIPIFLGKYSDALRLKIRSIRYKHRGINNPNKDSAILFCCYYLDKRILREFKKIRKACSNSYDVILVYDNTRKDFTINDEFKSYLFDNKSIEKLGYHQINDADANLMGLKRGIETVKEKCRTKPGVWYNPEFIVLNFFLKNPTYKYYWYIEYDVHFNGLWSIFFDYFLKNDADFIGTKIKKYKDHPEWRWWNAMNITVPINQQVGSLFPIERYSNRALELLDRKYKSGVFGFNEVIVPTLMNLEGFKIEDIGKKWYDEETINWHRGMRKGNKLSHPIK